MFFRKEYLLPSARLVDLFSKVLQKYLKDLYLNCEAEFGFSLNVLAWNAEDGLLEQEIECFQREGRSVFPSTMIPKLIQIQQERRGILTGLLRKTFDGAIHPNRVFCTLSSGEQRRLINLLTLEAALVSDDAKLIILDEPLANLDEKNIDLQLMMLRTFQQVKELPFFIITHHHILEIEQALIPEKLLPFPSSAFSLAK